MSFCFNLTLFFFQVLNMTFPAGQSIALTKPLQQFNSHLHWNILKIDLPGKIDAFARQKFVILVLLELEFSPPAWVAASSRQQVW